MAKVGSAAASRRRRYRVHWLAPAFVAVCATWIVMVNSSGSNHGPVTFQKPTKYTADAVGTNPAAAAASLSGRHQKQQQHLTEGSREAEDEDDLVKQQTRQQEAREEASAGSEAQLAEQQQAAEPEAEAQQAAGKQSPGDKAQATPDPNLQQLFEDAYKTAAWGHEGNGSGSGSTLEKTAVTRALLIRTIDRLEIGSMIDVPCGAMAWMPLVLAEAEKLRPGFRYLGLDIARQVIEKNQEVYRDQPNWSFASMDMTTQPLPDGYELVHCRDALQHLSCRKTVDALEHLAAGARRYLLVGSYNLTEPYKDIPDGSVVNLNLRLPPFSLPEPLAVLDEQTVGEPSKFELLYSTPELRRTDWKAMRLRCDLVPKA